MMLGRRKGRRILIEDTSESSSEVPENATRDLSHFEGSSTSQSSQSLVDYSPVLTQPSNLSIRKKILQKQKSRNSRFLRISSVDSTPSTSENFQGEEIHLKILDEETSLYYYVKNDTPLDDIVNEWIKEYRVSRKDAVLLLMQFILDSFGCKKFITPELYDSSRLMTAINKEFCFTEDGKYHFLKTSFEWKEFYENFSRFVYILIEECHKSEILYDTYFTGKFISFLIKLSESNYQGLRHTSTLAAVKMISSLVNINKYLKHSASDVSESEPDMENTPVNKLIVELLEKIFAFKFVDYVSKIRLLCMQELDIWLKAIPEYFIQDDFLKYVGRSIFDSDAEVRLTCLEILQPLYASDGILKLRNFTKKFKERLISMTLDVNRDVGVIAMKIVLEILKKERLILNDDDFGFIFKLVFESHQPLARLAGKFLMVYISLNSDEETVTSESSSNMSLIQDLVIFFQEASLPQFVDLYVDSLFDNCEIIKDWNAMTNLLLEYSGPDETSLDKDKITILVVIMLSSIKLAATGEIPNPREAKQKVTANRKRQIKEDQERITKHFIENLPDLIVKYKLDDEILAKLLLIPQYFDLSVYTKYKKEEDLDLLLVEIQAVIEVTTNEELLKNAIKALYNLCTEGYAIFGRCDAVRSKIIDGVIQIYKRNVEDLSIANANSDNGAECFSKITQDLKKIANFYSYFDLNSWQIWDSLMDHITDALSIESEKLIPVEAVKYCLMSLYSSILYDRRHLKDWIDSDSQIEGRCNSLREHLDTYMEMMIDLMTEENVKKPVAKILKEHAHSSFCDLLLIFCNQLASHPNPLMHQLVYETNSRIENAVYKFLLDYVFINDESEEEMLYQDILMERLNKKKKILSNYCKLIAYNIIPTKCSSHMFTNYDKFNNDFGDLFKETLIAAMGINRVNCALTLLHTLIILFEKLKDEDGIVNSHTKKFMTVQELGKKFAALFGTNALKNKEAMICLHRTGIVFSFQVLEDATVDLITPPLNLPFLKILSEFTSKLLEEDKITILEFLDGKLDWEIKFLRNDKWLPLKFYRGFLNQSKEKKGKEKKKTQSTKKDNRKFSTSSRKEPLVVTKTTFPRKNITEYSSALNEIAHSSGELSSISTIDHSSTPSILSSADNALGADNSEMMEVSPVKSTEDEDV